MVHRPSSIARSSGLFALVLLCVLSLFACSRPTSDRESAELGTTRQAASQPTGVDPTESPTWPTDFQWIPLMKGGTALYDIVKDKSGSADVVGDATHPSIYVYSDGTHLFWRLRVNANPAAGYPNFDNSGIWVCLVNTDTDYGTYEWLTWVNGKGTVDTTEVWRNTSTSPSYYDSPSDSPDQFISALNINNNSTAHARVVNTASTISPSTFPTNSADADYFVDAAFDISSFAGTITSTTPLRLACGTSATSQGLNADFTSPSNATTLSALYSDPMTCGLTGCPVCNTASACGDTCTACTGTTPVCTAGACAACNGDYGSGTTNACSSASNPYCASNGSCTTCTSNADCTAGTATHGGHTCTAGACTDTCMTDSQCASNQYCSMMKCVSKLSNGTTVPFEPTHVPPLMGCDATSGATVCTSGVCDTTDIKCGYADRTQTCATDTQCRSGTCGPASHLCQPANGCSADGDCASGNYCDGVSLTCVPKLSNGTPTVTDSIHTGTCPALGVECASGVCDTDGKCGYANGGGTCDATNGLVVCRSGSCSGTKCGCASDNDCASTEFCLASTASCTTKLANGASTISDALHTASCPTLGVSECQSGNCGTASNVCLAAGACAADGDCLSTQYCNGTTCVAKLANNVATSTDSIHTGTCPALGVECVTGACDTDGKCGYALGNGSCTGDTSSVCRSGVCGSGGKCGCAADSECASGEFCNGTACVTKLANGVATSTDAIHTSSCPTLGVAECQSGTCDSDGKCGLGNGTACTSATASLCRSGTCGAGSNVCIAAGACAADGDCSSTMYCNGSSCTPKKANGTATATDPLHTGACPALGVECVSTVCDANDNLCGYAVGHGTCDNTNGLVVCRTGVCSTSGTCGCSADTDCSASEYCSSSTKACTAKLDLGGTCNSSNASQVCASGACGSASLACIPNTGSGCWTDSDCLGTQFCTAAHSCTNKLANGEPIPSDAAHAGACTSDNATAVCASGKCDTADNKCGLALEHSVCASTDQCRAGVCILTGENAGRCEPCLTDASCSGSTPACDATNHCVACTATNDDLCTGNTPLCNTTTNACTGCSSDHTATPTTGSCPSANTPFCTSAGACDKCTTNSDCTGHAGGAFCDLTTGACGSGCTSDSDCASTQWCSNPTAQPVSGTCVPKLANDDLVPSSLLVDGKCTTALAQRVCASGVCDADDAHCGYTNRTACSAASECRSAVCNLDGKCGDPNGTACLSTTTCRSNECAIDGKCGKNNGEACADDVVCRTGSCVSGTCGRPNGQACATDYPAACRSGICFTDSACGLPNGRACTAGNECRSGSCYQGRCEPTCEVDAQCASGFFCNAEASHCDDAFANGESCTRNAMCKSGVCNADGKCGDPDGFACTVALTCRNGGCVENKCTSALEQGMLCTRDASCKSHVCADDGRCGVPTGGACSSPSQCREGACGPTGRCGLGCAQDGECAATSWCSLTGGCEVDGANGAACVRDSACRSGRCSAGQCGAQSGETCSSNRECRSNACDPVTHRCGYENGNGPCAAETAAQVCISGACGPDGKCGLPSNGPTCEFDKQCRGAACDVTRHTCNACKADKECASNEFCGAGNCKQKLENGLGCGLPSHCVSNVCGSDGRCGQPDGEVCTSTAVCRSDLCTNGFCGAPTSAPATPNDAGAPDAAAPTADASTTLPAPSSAATPDGGTATSANAANDSEVLQGGGGLTCASTPRSSTTAPATFGMLALAVGGLFSRRRKR